MRGYAKIWRKIFTKGYHKNHLLFTMMVYFITHAQWEPKTVLISGNKKIKLKRGQMVTNERNLAKFFGVGRQRIRTTQGFMENVDFLTQELTQGIRVVTIRNYDEYQSQNSEANPNPNPQLTQDLTQVPFKKIKNIKNTRAHAQGENIPSKEEKAEITAAASRRIEATTKYLNEKTAITPALDIDADDIKSKLRKSATQQKTTFK